MSLLASEASERRATPAWVWDVVGAPQPGGEPADEARVMLAGRPFVYRRGILRACPLLSESQAQTRSAFAFKWRRRDTFESAHRLEAVRAWLLERYGDVPAAAWWPGYGPQPLVLDAGCGAGVSALALLGPVLARVRYLGVDVSDAVDVAAARFRERGMPGGFLQADLAALPLAPGSVDVIFSEGVLHHTDSTEAALAGLARLLRPDGRLLFYVYRRKGPIREFTDDYIRDRLQEMAPAEAWEALLPLTRLGKCLGDLDVVVDVPEDVTLLGIPAGPIPLQRLFYWHVFKAFHDPNATLDELNHINFDWYAPRNAHRQSPDEVTRWCAEAALEIERLNVQDAGITVIARKR